MLPVALRGIITMDIEELQKDILTAYDTDPTVQSILLLSLAVLSFVLCLSSSSEFFDGRFSELRRHG
jgi:hypothetical protein